LKIGLIGYKNYMTKTKNKKINSSTKITLKVIHIDETETFHCKDGDTIEINKVLDVDVAGETKQFDLSPILIKVKVDDIGKTTK